MKGERHIFNGTLKCNYFVSYQPTILNLNGSFGNGYTPPSMLGRVAFLPNCVECFFADLSSASLNDKWLLGQLFVGVPTNCWGSFVCLMLNRVRIAVKRTANRPVPLARSDMPWGFQVEFTAGTSFQICDRVHKRFYCIEPGQYPCN